ncbi:hypothetical protein FNF27_02414 [Cafeteria roenbergensis]|uniref:EamA domain-containing protein n=1 Tax=Cafeteria roenbergensis TaxID=33653 RepID=A0A5A8EER7_CAFRO|nr:hypothetical protein FNF27_02414 [Cafeteria roenbergensis]
MSETLTTIQVGFEKPFFIAFVVHVGYGILLPAGVASAIYRVRTGRAKFACAELLCCGERSGRWAYGKGREAVRGPPPLFPSPLSVLLLASVGLSFLIVAVAYTWYKSLPLTSVPANNAIYQSCSAAVFVFSVLLLGEKFTWHKLVAVAISISGIVLVAFGGSTSDATDSTPTAEGYILVVVSVVTYAFYEVLYAKIGEAHHACPGAPGVKSHEEEDEEEEEDAEGEGEGEASAAARATTGSAFKADAGATWARGRELSGVSGALSPGQSSATALLLSGDEGSVGEAESGPGADRDAQLEEAAQRLGAWAAPPSGLWSQTELSALMMGLFGVATLLFVWPLIPLLDATGLEPFEWPIPAQKWEMMMLNAALDTVYNVLLLIGILISSPLVISVGVMMVVPSSMVVDGILHNTRFQPLAYGGVALIVLGFLVLKLPERMLHRAMRALGCGSCLPAEHAEPRPNPQGKRLADKQPTVQ